MPKTKKDNVILVGTDEELTGLDVSTRLSKLDRKIDKRPTFLEGRTYVRRAEGKKWYVTINLYNGLPLEVFVNTNSRDSQVIAKDGIDKLEKLARYYEVDEIFIQAQRVKSEHQTSSAKFCRVLSMCLRHGVPLLEVVNTLDLLDHGITNFTYHVEKLLGSYLPDTPLPNGQNICPECKNSTLIYSGGCKQCNECGWTKC